MSNFYIKQLIAYGNGKTPSKVSFINGLNIVHGESNTGKTCIANSIFYLFGKEESDGLFDTEKTGYSDLEMILRYKDEYDISFKRTIGDKRVFVSSTCPEFDSGEYKLKSSKPGEQSLNDLILKMIGLPETPLIGVNASSKKEKLSWRTFTKALYLDKDSVDLGSSPIVPSDTNKSTRVLSALLYFLTGEDHSAQEAGLSAKERKSRKEAIAQFVKKQIETTEIRISELQTLMDSYGTQAQVRQIIEETKESIAHLTSGISISKQKLSKNLNSIQRVEDDIQNKEIVSSRYTNLISQYLSDIERLNFIANGEEILQDDNHNMNCPFCGSQFRTHSLASCIDAANIEVRKIISQLEEVQNLNEELSKEIAFSREMLSKLQIEKDENEKTLNSMLAVKKEQLEKLDSFFKYDKLFQEFCYLTQLLEKLPKELEKYTDPKDIRNPKYNPKDYYDEEFLSTMSSYMRDLLTELGSKVTDARIDLNTFDIVVDGYKKQNTQGQGYSSLYNTVLFLCLNRYFREHAAYDPNLLVIDTPLLGLSQWDERIEESYGNRLYTYLYKHKREGQMIIIENSSMLPAIEGSDVNIIQFTGLHNQGRHGFLIDYHA